MCYDKPMLKNDIRGVIDPLLFPLIIAIVIALGMAGFSLWAYINYTDQRDNVDAKITTAVDEAKQQQVLELETAFIEREKEPLVSYQAPSTLASVKVSYPKTWSAYVDEGSQGNNAELDAYFHPKYVRAVESDTSDALRIMLENKNYSKELGGYNKSIEDGLLSASAVNISGVDGVRLDGEIEKGITGSIVLLPVRDKVLKIWTESIDFRNDFDKNVLPNFSFVP